MMVYRMRLKARDTFQGSDINKFLSLPMETGGGR